MASTESDAPSPESAYNDLRRLIPSLAAELDHLRASLREHNLWLQRYGHGQSDAQSDDAALAALPAALPIAVAAVPPAASEPVRSGPPAPGPPASGPPASAPPPAEPHEVEQAEQAEQALQFDALAEPPAAAAPSYSSNSNASPPPYAASDVPLYSTTVRDDVSERRDQLMEWLKEGEDVLRDYSARFAQLAAELHLPAEDALGTWNMAAPDNSLPSYTTIERREELMVGGVGEVPPVYARGTAMER